MSWKIPHLVQNRTYESDCWLSLARTADTNKVKTIVDKTKTDTYKLLTRLLARISANQILWQVGLLILCDNYFVTPYKVM